MLYLDSLLVGAVICLCGSGKCLRMGRLYVSSSLALRLPGHKACMLIVLRPTDRIMMHEVVCWIFQCGGYRCVLWRANVMCGSLFCFDCKVVVRPPRRRR